MSELVVLQRDGDVAILTLNRPDKRNALSLAVWSALEDHIAAIEAAGQDIGAVILRAAGPVFCAGNDLRERGAAVPRPNYQAGIVTRLERIGPPLIVAVQGGCYTGGLELALAGDIIVAAESASFADTHGKFALVPIWGMSQRLPRRVGSYKAREISFTGRNVPGREAERIGLANMCVPDDQLDARALEIAQAISAQSRHSIFAYKQLYLAQQGLRPDEGLAHEVYFSAGVGPDAADRISGPLKK